ncbi:hypothetical protein F4777DRAFT_28285 [Nemania sp. FL0916]|nr:hypothetical protein F4777DRAFT_28285 [Nemania sp. FL0916]
MAEDPVSLLANAIELAVALALAMGPGEFPQDQQETLGEALALHSNPGYGLDLGHETGLSAAAEANIRNALKGSPNFLSTFNRAQVINKEILSTEAALQATLKVMGRMQSPGGPDCLGPANSDALLLSLTNKDIDVVLKSAAIVTRGIKHQGQFGSQAEVNAVGAGTDYFDRLRFALLDISYVLVKFMKRLPTAASRSQRERERRVIDQQPQVHRRCHPRPNTSEVVQRSPLQIVAHIDDPVPQIPQEFT